MTRENASSAPRRGRGHAEATAAVATPGPRPYRPRVVIIGGGFGGLSAARALAASPVRVTLIDRHNHHLFQPLLYQVATAALSPGEIAVPIRSILRRQRNVRVLLADVEAIDPVCRRVEYAGGVLHYDYLIVAAGARHSYFGHPDWELLAPGLKTIEDALEIRRRVLGAYERAEREVEPLIRQAWMTFVVVGGGPTGVELAGAIAEIAGWTLAGDFRVIDPRNSRVYLIEGGPRLLPTFPETLSAKAKARLLTLGVSVQTGTVVTEITPEGVVAGGTFIRASTVLWGAGNLASPLGASLGAEQDRAGRVAVGADLSVPGHPEVFVIGDQAVVRGQDGKPLPGTAPVAMQEGRHVAANIARLTSGAPAAPFRYRDHGNIATIGRKAAVADIRGLKLDGFIAWLVWSVAHLFYLIGFENRVLVFLRWTWSYFTYQRGARLITGAVAPAPSSVLNALPARTPPLSASPTTPSSRR